ncbi:phage holin family protein [uncultured Selenomonas sp.]
MGEPDRLLVYPVYSSAYMPAIIENAARMGLPVPQKLQDMMHSIKNQEGT